MLFPAVHPGERVYYLIDSTAEYYPPLNSQAFHIYLPPQCLIYSSGAVRAPVPVNISEGVTVLVRAFDHAGGDPEGAWTDTACTLRVNIRPWASGVTDMAYPMTLDVFGSFLAFNPGPDGWLAPDFSLYPSYTPAGGIAFTHHLSSYMGWSVRIERDPVLDYRFIARGIWDWELLGLEIGGFLGVHAPEAVFINPGLSVLFKLKVPQGIFEFSARVDSSMGRELRDQGDFLQDLYDLHIVALIPAVTLDLSLNSRSATIKAGGQSLITNNWTRYELLALITALSIPLKPGIALGWQEISWIYGPYHYGYGNFYAGLQVSWNIFRNLEICLSADAPILPFDWLQDPRASAILNASLGLRWSF